MQPVERRPEFAAGARRHIHGLYAVTPDEHDTARLAAMVQATIVGGASLVQYRNKAVAARARWSAGKIVSASCYDRLSSTFAAQQAGATYVAFGSFLFSRVKPGAVSPGLHLPQEAKSALAVPVVAIGGITATNARQLLAAGADCVAAISALFAPGNVEFAARQFAGFFVHRS